MNNNFLKRFLILKQVVHILTTALEMSKYFI